MDLAPAIALCKHFEGFYAKPYLCPAGVPTIGYGTTRYPDGTPVRMSDPPVTQLQATEYLLHELTRNCAPAVTRLTPTVYADALRTNNWSRFNAIVDFVYNLGAGRLQTSTLRRKLQAQDWEGAKQQLALWVRASGRILPGLVRRRQAEINLM